MSELSPQPQPEKREATLEPDAAPAPRPEAAASALRSNETAAQSTAPDPLKIGFRVIEGGDAGDVHRWQPGPEGTPGANITKFDNKAERFGRIEKYLNLIDRVAATAEQRKQAVQTLVDLQQQLQDKALDEQAEVIDYVKRVIANFNNEPALKLVLIYGAREITQDLITRVGNQAMGYVEDRDSDLYQAAWSALELAKEKYGQEHDGRAYQTAEDKQRFQEAKERASRIKIS